MRGHVRKRRTLGVHRRCRSSSRDQQTTPEEQVRVCSKEGGRERSARLHPLRRRWGRSAPGTHHPCGAPQSLDRIPGCPGPSLAHLGGLRGHFRREIVPVIGGLEIAKLRPGHVRAVLAGMQRRGLSAATITQARSALGSALRQAVEDGLIPANPVAAVKRPKLRRPELHWPTPDQLAALIAASKDTILGDPGGAGGRNGGTTLRGPRHLLG